MALCVCKCLNVTLGSDKVEDNVDIKKLELSPTEQRDIFFSEKLVSTPLNSLKSQVVQPALVCQRAVGRWTLHSCLACGLVTHAISQDRPSTVLIPKATQTTQEKINNLKKTSNFSPVFNLLVPEVTSLDMKENVDTNNIVNDKKGWQPAQQAIGTLSKQLTQTLQSQLEAIEDTVRQFRDQKYAEFEAYKDRAQRDHKILASIVSKTRDSLNGDGFRVDTSLDNGPPSPQLPPLQRRRLSSFKDAKKTSQNIVKHNRDLPPEEDSLEAEDIFDIEGMDSHNHMISDQDDYDDSDVDVSNDEGIHIVRGRGAANLDLARSLPINVPVFPAERAARETDTDEEPHDIAASIKALARSVHGDVFELPRPRFSTQI
ncbi:uncharacterized protein LOC134662459 [Cydia amplana]|uniref:uncharacterized protein LOC134662459 n=1 Tax=Cydia amplana TaxID=1869771 RepID=UPI002FE6BCD3